MTYLSQQHSRRGFTLFEVGISLVIVSVGVLTVMMLMPAGLKAQQVARFQILASAKAIELMSVNANQWRKWDEQRLEGQTLAQNTINMAAHTPLVEQKACNYRHGSLPVPLEIARRLDADNDEIQQVLRQGGYLFYSSPRPIASIDEDEISLEDLEIPNESQRLVWAYVGHAQPMGLANHPCKAWPYYDWYPAPPRARMHPDNSSPISRHEDSWRLNGWPSITEFEAVCTAWKTVYALTNPTKADVIIYRDKAKELVAALSMPRDLDGIPNEPTGTAYTPVEPYRVLAASYLSQAMVWLTRTTFAPTAAENTQAQKAHEHSLKWLHRHVTTDPYDWGIDRALNFQNGWDHPLLEFQLFDSTAETASWRTADFFTAPNGDISWRVLSGQPVKNAGTSTSYGLRSVMAPFPAPVAPPRPSGNKIDIEESWGEQAPGVPDTFTLTRPFQPAERCRQLVFWAVDWKAYSDSETVPSAPQDASRVPYDSDGLKSYHDNAHKFNNPEVYFTWTVAPNAWNLAQWDPMHPDKDYLNNKPPEGLSSKSNYLGLYGADRNGNRRLDIGSVPSSVRMRAVSVARFNIYQPRVWSGLRN